MKIVIDLNDKIIAMLKLALLASSTNEAEAKEATEFIDSHINDSLTYDISELGTGGVQVALGLALLAVGQTVNHPHIKEEDLLSDALNDN